MKHGWHVAVAYVIGFFVLLLVMGWPPGEKRDTLTVAPPAAAAPSTGG